MFRIGRRSLERAAADHERFRRALQGADFHVYQLPNALHVFPQTFVASQCQGAQRILTVEEVQLVLERFQRTARRSPMGR
jgi:hypothetical protein